MGSWHTCDTTHCIAGWAVRLAGDEGKALEEKFGTANAGLALLGTEAASHFYDTQEKGRAWLQSKLETTPVTDIDVLIAYAKRELKSYPQLSRAVTNALIDAITTERAKIAALEEANGILEDALQEVGDDYPGSSCQEWCSQQVRAARQALGDTHD